MARHTRAPRRAAPGASQRGTWRPGPCGLWGRTALFRRAGRVTLTHAPADPTVAGLTAPAACRAQQSRPRVCTVHATFESHRFVDFQQGYLLTLICLAFRPDLLLIESFCTVHLFVQGLSSKIGTYFICSTDGAGQQVNNVDEDFSDFIHGMATKISAKAIPVSYKRSRSEI